MSNEKNANSQTVDTSLTYRFSAKTKSCKARHAMPPHISDLVDQLSEVIEGQKDIQDVKDFVWKIKNGTTTTLPDSLALQALLRMMRMKKHADRANDAVDARHDRAVAISGLRTWRS